ncbi:cytosine permease, partial [Streptomyces sp. SID7499]|nr:cytosine permease [Streptomyces sp. SID7499]
MASAHRADATAPEVKSIGSDDYSLSRVPRDKRFGFWSMLLQWLAQSGSISQFTLGATIGVGMTIG